MSSKKQRKETQGKLACAICEGKVGEDEARCGDRGTVYEGKLLCETCYERDESCATVYFGEDDTPNTIGEARNDTDGTFVLQWIPTDLWRGRYSVTSSTYVLVNDAEVLAWHESQTMLADFDKKVRALFQKDNVDYARVFARTSNAFAQNYLLFVKKGQAFLASVLVGLAKKKADYDNPKWGRGILFDEATLSKISALFPEESVKQDEDAVKLAQRYGENLIPELKARLAKLNKDGGEK